MLAQAELWRWQRCCWQWHRGGRRQQLNQQQQRRVQVGSRALALRCAGAGTRRASSCSTQTAAGWVAVAGRGAVGSLTTHCCLGGAGGSSEGVRAREQTLTEPPNILYELFLDVLLRPSDYTATFKQVVGT